MSERCYLDGSGGVDAPGFAGVFSGEVLSGEVFSGKAVGGGEGSGCGGVGGVFSGWGF